MSRFPFVVKAKNLNYNNLCCEGAVVYSLSLLSFPHNSVEDTLAPRVAVVRDLSPHIGARGHCMTGTFG